LGINRFMPAFFTAPGWFIFEKFEGTSTFRARNIKNGPWLPVPAVLSWAPHWLSSFPLDAPDDKSQLFSYRIIGEFF